MIEASFRGRPWVCPALWLMAVVMAWCAGATRARAESPSYFAGGTIPFPAEARARLDRHAELLSLGVNHDWLLASRIDVDLYTRAIDVVGNAVRQGVVPGAVILADRFQSNTMPAAVGYLMTDPQRHRVKVDTRYFLDDLTGFLVTVPLALAAVDEGKLALDDRVGDHLGALSGTPLGRARVEHVLRHAAGLPAEPPEVGLMERDELIAALGRVPLESEPGTRAVASAMNFLVLGLLLEEVEGVPLVDLMNPLLQQYFGGGVAMIGAHPDERQLLAPGKYSRQLGHMAWGDAEDGWGRSLMPSAGHTGLIASADDVMSMCKALMTTAVLGEAGDTPTSPTMVAALRGDSAIEGGEQMGLGFQVDRFGPGSFGWDSPAGSSVWILPGQFAFVVYLSNAEHPHGAPDEDSDPRKEALPLLARAMGWGSGPIDTGAMPEESDSDRPEPAEELSPWP